MYPMVTEGFLEEHLGCVRKPGRRRAEITGTGALRAQASRIDGKPDCQWQDCRAGEQWEEGEDIGQGQMVRNPGCRIEVFRAL